MTVAVNTSGHLYDDFLCLIFRHSHREFYPKPRQWVFRWGLLFHSLSTWSFIHLPRFFHSRRDPPLLTPSLVLYHQRSPLRHMIWVHFVSFTGFTVHHSFLNLCLSEEARAKETMMKDWKLKMRDLHTSHTLGSSWLVYFQLNKKGRKPRVQSVTLQLWWVEKPIKLLDEYPSCAT